MEELTLKAEQAKHETEALMEQKQLKNKKINKLREELAEVNREIGKVDDELNTTLAHKDFIMSLSTAFSAAAKKGKKKQVESDESESDFFITKPEQHKNEEMHGLEEYQEEKEELPIDKAMLMNLMDILSKTIQD